MNKFPMNTLIYTLVIANLLMFTHSINAQNSSWVGEYSLGESNDKQISGPEIYVPVRINIAEQDGNLTAHLYGKSSNIAIDIYANVVNEGNKINLFYKEVGRYHTWKKKFNKNDLLLSLERNNSTVPNNILTYWGEFSPITEDRVESGKPYFRKLIPKNDEWVRIETKDKKFSVLFPKNFLVHEVSKRNEWLRAYGFKDGVDMQFSVVKRKLDLRRLANPAAQALFGKTRLFKIGDLEVMWTNVKFGAKYRDAITLQDKNRSYTVSVSADTPQKPALRTFISGILINGKPLVKNMPVPFEVKKRHLISELRTSPEVKEGLNRKRVKIERKITYKPLGEFSVYGDSPNLFSRGSFPLVFQANGFRVYVNRPEKVYIQMELRADGQVGDMTVYYSGNQKYARDCAKSFSTMKFVPAQVNGRPVNSVRVGVCGESGWAR